MCCRRSRGLRVAVDLVILKAMEEKKKNKSVQVKQTAFMLVTVSLL